MNKQIRNIILFLGILLFIGIIFSSNDSSNTSIDKGLLKNTEKIYDAPYYFNYYFVDKGNFSPTSKYKLTKAFEIINKETNNNFIFNETENISDADFILSFSKEDTRETIEETSYKIIYETTFGEAYVLGKEYYPYKENSPAEITMYKRSIGDSINPTGTCGKNYPNIEMHEIFHSLGLDHSEDEDSIMYSESHCTKLGYEDTKTIPLLYEKWGIGE